MPLFKKKTAEEKEAIKQAKAEQQLQNSIDARKILLEEQIFPHMSNDYLKETIRNLDLELSQALYEKFEVTSVLKLEQILKHDLEELVGFVSGRSSETKTSPDVFIACTTLRIIFISKGVDGFSAYTYDHLNSLAVNKSDSEHDYTLDEFRFNFESISLKIYFYRLATDKLSGVIHEMRNSERMQEVTLQNIILPRIKDEKMKDTIQNLDWKLRFANTEYAYSSIAKLEHILVNNLEKLLGYTIGIEPNVFPNNESLLVFTTTRVFFIDQFADGKVTDSFLYNKLNSIKVEAEAITLFTPMEEYRMIINANVAQEVAEAINKAKDAFMANPDNFESAPMNVNAITPGKEDEKSITEQLNELKQLLYSRTITQEQYDNMKAKITE